MSGFPNLFSPGRIGKLHLQNRIVFPPMATHMASRDGDITDQLLHYYRERSRGVALVVIEGSFPSGVGHPHRIVLDHDGRIPGLQRLIDVIHQEGAKAFIEVNTHMGRSDKNPLSPSDVPHPVTGVKGKPADLADIKKMVHEYGEAAKRVKEAGFDGIMIHGATGYLVAEFLSPLVNKRTDDYGGDVRRRARFALDLVEATRKNAGPDYPLIFRLMAHDRVPGGFDTDDAVATCRLLQDQGVDAVDIVTGSAVSHEWTAPSMYLPPGCNTDVSGAVKAEVTIPVLVAGKINEPHLAEEILRRGKADFVDIGRGLLADPGFVTKTLAGKPGTIRRCIACLRCAEQYLFFPNDPIHCTVNPAVGKERRFASLGRAKKARKVVVVGGGPAGMQAAFLADQRGHDVTLLEKSRRLGGNLNLAHVPSGKGDMKSFLEDLERRLLGSGVKVKLGVEASAPKIRELAPDAVVFATGSSPFVVDIPGIQLQNVISFRDVLGGAKEITGKKVVVWGAGLVGCETAYFLAEKGNEVTLAFPEAEPAPEVTYADNRKALLKKVRDSHVKIEPGVKEFKEITPGGVAWTDRDGKHTFLPAEVVVVATGARPNRILAEPDRVSLPEPYEVGDCVQVRRLLEAVHEGAQAGMKI